MHPDPALIPAKQVSTRFTYLQGMELTVVVDQMVLLFSYVVF